MAEERVFPKLSKEDVDYRKGRPGHSCEDCEYFESDAGTCKEVKGLIRPSMLCDVFEPSDSDEDDSDDDDEGSDDTERYSTHPNGIAVV